MAEEALELQQRHAACRLLARVVPSTALRLSLCAVLVVAVATPGCRSGAIVAGEDSLPPPPPPRTTLTIAIIGQGEVMTSDNALSCNHNDSRCSFQVDQGADLRLLAKPADGHEFNQWQGDCAGADATDCELTNGSSLNVFASFRQIAASDKPPVEAVTGAAAGVANVAASREQTVGPIGEWPWRLEACESAPTVVWGDYQAAPRAPDADNNGIPDVAEAARAAGRFFWFDPGAPGVGSPAQGDPNGVTRGDTLDAAFDTLTTLGGGTLGIIGLGEDHPYQLLGFSETEETEMSGFVYANIIGDIEICAINDVAVISNASGGTLRWVLTNNHDFIVKNVKLDGIEVMFRRNSQSKLWWYHNVWIGNTGGKCPQYSDNRNLADTLLRPAQAAPGIGGGGTWGDPTAFVNIRLENSQFHNCNTNRYSHGFYIETEGCFLYMNNSILEGVNNLEVWRILCRAVVIENSRFSNALDWDGTTFGSSPIDLRSNSAWVFRNNHVRVKAGARDTRFALAVRSRRDNTGSSLPNQWPGPDAASDDFAGNEDWTSTHRRLARLVAARSTDAWLHNGWIWNREFWREVTSSPWRGDQRTLTYSGAGFSTGATVRGLSSGASGFLWKIEGNDLHVTLDSDKEFVAGERIVSGDANGTLDSQTPVTARALAENEHLFAKYLSGNVFEASCLGTECPGLIPFQSFGSLPGVGFGNGNRYFVVPRDTDPDRLPDDDYDTAAIPGDGWVERVILFATNNTFIGDWSALSANRPRLINHAVGEPLVFNDGERTVEVWEAAASGPPPVGNTSSEAMTPQVAPPTFLIDIGGSAEKRLDLPAWWPQGDIKRTCEQLRRRYGDDPMDPDDYHWWDEPGAETGHAKIGHDGFPIHDGINTCPD